MAHYPELKGRHVVITGGGNGIGASLVRAFHTQGAQVSFCDQDEAAGQSLAAELGDSVSFTKVDLRQEAEVVSWVRHLGEAHGKIDVLVNNAARDPRCSLRDMTTEQWDDLFALNLRAYFLTCREASAVMPASSGSIINLSSITFHLAPAEMSAYVATKAGILGFTRSLGRELGPRHIRVNAVSPGWVMTERQMRQFVTPEVKELILKSQSIPDLLQPEDIADVVVFLGSDASRAMTGQELLVDRGWMHS